MCVYTHPDLYLNQDLAPVGFFLPVWFVFLVWHPWVQICGENTLEGWWATLPYCDCFSCCAVHFWFKYLMTLIKQHLNFLWDPGSAFRIILWGTMAEMSFSERPGLRRGFCSCWWWRSGPQPNGRHPVGGILPIKRCIKTVLLVRYVSSLHHFRVQPWHVLGPCTFPSW